jgi:hypothetical protein
MKKRMKKRFPVIIFLVLFLLLQCSVFVCAQEEIDYEMYDKTAEDMGYERPTHFLIKITGGVHSSLKGETLEIKEGQTLNKNFNFVDESGDEKVRVTKKYSLNLFLKYDARAMQFTGEYELIKETTTSSSVPKKFYDVYPDGERNEYERRTNRGPVGGRLTSSGEQYCI